MTTTARKLRALPPDRLSNHGRRRRGCPMTAADAPPPTDAQWRAIPGFRGLNEVTRSVTGGTR
ncbi:hypothetical protein LAUMK41_03921 [Mycobacterium attenuatum]|nr:hypothetical protein LAUMK41_03921 [Mycobacterium attenuatum]